LVIAVGNDSQFRATVEVLGVPELADDPRFATNPARVQHRDELFTLMCAQLATAGAQVWFERLSARGVPCGPINDVAGAFGLAQRLGLSPVVDAEDVPTVANPIGLSVTAPTYRHRPPRLGSDTDDVVTWLRHEPDPR